MNSPYPCILTPEEDAPGYVVTFPDVPEAITGGATRQESLVVAQNALVVALSMYVEAQEEIPAPSAASEEHSVIAVPPRTAAQLALYKTKRRKGVHEPKVHRR